MNTVIRSSYEPYHIIRTIIEIIDNYPFLSYNNQTLNFKNKISCVGDKNFFYLNENGKLQILNIQKQILPVKNNI